MKVKVSVKDLARVLEEADYVSTTWSNKGYKARRRLLKAIEDQGYRDAEYDCGVPGCKDFHYNAETPTTYYGTDYCRIPACGCPGDPHS